MIDLLYKLGQFVNGRLKEPGVKQFCKNTRFHMFNPLKKLQCCTCAKLLCRFEDGEHGLNCFVKGSNPAKMYTLFRS